MPVVIITGTSRGLGLAIAVHLARKGYEVYATMRDLDRAGPLREVTREEGLPVCILQLDVTDEDSVQRAVEGVLARSGRIDVLVNNAGILRHSPIEFTSDAAVREVLDTNLFGCLRTIRAVLPAMRAQCGGTIVNLSSVAGRFSFSCGGPYFMSKHALETASEMLAQEVTPFGIRVAILEPGFHATDMLDGGVPMLGQDPNSPYAEAERRLTLILAQGRQIAGDPVVAAEAVHHAVTTAQPKLRYLVGPDADSLIDGRQRTTDEEWVALGRTMTDDEFFAEFAAIFAPPTLATEP